MTDEGRRFKGAGCWLMVQEVHPVSDLLSILLRGSAGIRAHEDPRHTYAKGSHVQGGKTNKIDPHGGGGIFYWNNLSKFALSVHTKFVWWWWWWWWVVGV